MIPDFIRYLEAKKSVDDRALNGHVWQAMSQVLSKRPFAERPFAERPFRVLEIGAGIGTMIERLAEHGLLKNCTYTAIDNQVANIASANQRLASLLSKYDIQLEAIDLFDFINREQERTKWDLIIAHAFLDLMDIEATLPQIFSLLQSEGYFYFTINFDGATLFEPTVDPVFDALVERLYHRTMDERVINGRLSGDSQSGRHLFQLIPQAGGKILAAGSSDWVVHATDGTYPADEAYFLQFIINTVAGALSEHPELDKAQFEEWVQKRRAQIGAGKLVYIAHQIDFWGQLVGK